MRANVTKINEKEPVCPQIKRGSFFYLFCMRVFRCRANVTKINEKEPETRACAEWQPNLQKHCFWTG